MGDLKTSKLSRRSVLKSGVAASAALAAPAFFMGKAHAATEKLRVASVLPILSASTG